MISLQNRRTETQEQDDLRYEIKYVSKEVDFGRVLSLVHGHRSGFSIHHASRKVNSLYFDSASCDCLDSGLAGLSERSKLRLRWYGDTLSPSQATLEHKQKFGALGRKVTQRIEMPFDFTQSSHSHLLRSLRLRVSGPLKHVLAMYCYPVLINSYRREYFVSANRKVRLTIDTQLRFYDQRLASRFNTRCARPSNGTLVVELKSQSEHTKLVIETANSFGFRATAFSKFAFGLLGQTSI